MMAGLDEGGRAQQVASMVLMYSQEDGRLHWPSLMDRLDIVGGS